MLLQYPLIYIIACQFIMSLVISESRNGGCVLLRRPTEEGEWQLCSHGFSHSHGALILNALFTDLTLCQELSSQISAPFCLHIANDQSPASSFPSLLGKTNHRSKLRQHYLHILAASHGALQSENS